MFYTLKISDTQVHQYGEHKISDVMFFESTNDINQLNFTNDLHCNITEMITKTPFLVTASDSTAPIEIAFKVSLPP